MASGLPFPAGFPTSSVFSVDGLHSATRALESSNVSIVIKGLNFLLNRSYDPQNDQSVNSILQLEDHPRLMHALSDLLDVVNPAARLLFDDLPNDSYYKMMQDEFDGCQWDMKLLGSRRPEFKFLAKHLDENSIFLTILGILRNFSYELINENIIACNATILRHLVCAVTASAVIGTAMECGQLAFDILLNIANKIDFSGKRRMQVVSGYVEDLPSDNMARDTLRFNASVHMAQSSTYVYMVAARSLIPAIYYFIHEKTMINRYFLVKALDLLSKLAKDNEKESYFKGALAAPMLDQLSLLLAVGLGRYETNIVPENYSISSDIYGKSRPPLSSVPPLVVHIQNLPSTTTIPLQALLLQQQQAKMNETSGILTPPSNLTSDQIDHEIRDLAIDSMLTLCRANERNALHLLKLPKLLHLLSKMAAVPTGSNSITPSHIGVLVTPQLAFRTEGNSKAAQILATLVSLPPAYSKMRSLRGDILVGAGNDDSLAALAATDFYFLSDLKPEPTRARSPVMGDQVAFY